MKNYEVYSEGSVPSEILEGKNEEEVKQDLYQYYAEDIEDRYNGDLEKWIKEEKIHIKEFKKC